MIFEPVEYVSFEDITINYISKYYGSIHIDVVAQVFILCHD